MLARLLHHAFVDDEQCEVNPSLAPATIVRTNASRPGIVHVTGDTDAVERERR